METSFKERCVELRKDGRSIMEIMRITGRPKTSIYQHIRHIPLSTERWMQIKKAAAEHIRKFPTARKGKSIRPFKPFSSWTPKLVLLVAHLSFDGELCHGTCAYNNRSMMLLERVQNLMRLVYDFDPAQYTNPLTGVRRISYYNVALSAYLKQKSTDLLNTIHALPVVSQKEFLRAFFDDEGCMDFRLKRNIRRIRGYQKNTNTLFVCQKLLENFNIQSHIEMPNEIVISGKENLRRFQQLIDFSKGVRINGNRSNSVWRKSIEKRVLLDRAIKSFKT